MRVYYIEDHAWRDAMDTHSPYFIALILLIAAALASLVFRGKNGVFQLPTLLTVQFRKGVPLPRMRIVAHALGLVGPMEEHDGRTFVFNVKHEELETILENAKKFPEIEFAEQHIFHLFPF